MKNRAFTLIELLAVIVILAIIALIATPIILNIINDTKKSSVERSKELYLDAVEIAIANKNLNEEFNPSICTVIEGGNLNCDTGELKIEVNGQVPKIGGTVTLKDGEVIGNTLEFGNGDKAEKETIGKAVTAENKTIAGNIPQGNYEPGDEYIIDVDGTNEYHFYILSVEGDKVNLIMNRNICSDGTLSTADNVCQTEWISKNDYNDDLNYGDVGNSDKGPITAMSYLYETTKLWNKIENIKMNYTDEGEIYGGISTVENTTKIMDKNGIDTYLYENLKARLPMKQELENLGCEGFVGGGCPAYIVNGLNPYSYPEGALDVVNNLNGYWSLSGGFATFNGSFQVGSTSICSVAGVSNQSGIRPVIELKKTDLS